jgi:hypothetical protein
MKDLLRKDERIEVAEVKLAQKEEIRYGVGQAMRSS